MGGLSVAIELLGFPTTLGLPRLAHRHAPEAVRNAGLIGTLERHDLSVTDLGDMELLPGVPADSADERVRKVVQAAEAQSGLWLQRHQPGNLMLTVGGDHSTSLGTIMALSRMGHNFDVVWIDAHGDFNILETSPSGNPHGMVLALACGLMPSFMPGLISPGSLRLWGIRDLDPGEQRLLTREHVEVLNPDQVRHERDRIFKRLKPSVLLSFDIDSVEPSEAPGTMTPVPGGFHRYEALGLVAQLARERNLLAVDIVECHPDQDRHNLTTSLAVQVAQAAALGQVERRINRQGTSAAAGN